jgi:diguanylate cyclase (GGDEF)-like protein
MPQITSQTITPHRSTINRMERDMRELNFYRRLLTADSAPRIMAADPSTFHLLFSSACATEIFGLNEHTIPLTALHELIPELSLRFLQQLWQRLLINNSERITLSNPPYGLDCAAVHWERRKVLAIYFDAPSVHRPFNESQTQHVLTNIYQRICEHLADGIALFDIVKGGQLYFAAANPALISLSSRHGENTLGQLAEDILPNPIAIHIYRLYRQCLAERKTVIQEFHQEQSHPSLHLQFTATLLTEAETPPSKLLISVRAIPPCSVSIWPEQQPRQPVYDTGYSAQLKYSSLADFSIPRNYPTPNFPDCPFADPASPVPIEALQSEREFRTLAEQLPSYVARLNRELQYTYVNPAYINATGIAESQWIGSRFDTDWHADNLTATDYAHLLQTALTEKTPQTVALEWIDQQGQYTQHCQRIVPEIDQAGNAHTLLILGFDVSDRHKQRLETERQRVFEHLAYGDDLDLILRQIGLYAETSQNRRYCLISLIDSSQRISRLLSPSLPGKCLSQLPQSFADGFNKAACPGLKQALKHGKRVAVDNTGNPICNTLCRTLLDATGATTCWSEPVFSSKNQLLGCVTLYVDQSKQPTPADLDILATAAQLSAIAIERKQAEARIYHQASYDVLTGMPNRRLFTDRLHEELARAERNGKPLALMFIDLDRFKEVNDTLGHSIGDRLLVEAANRIRRLLRESDTVARLAGDEFVAILPDLNNIASLKRIAQNLLMTLAREFNFGEHHAFISASIGIAIYPTDAEQTDTLLGCADQAMYAAKESGRNSYRFFTRNMLTQTQHRMQLAYDLRDALSKQQLEVHYQPIIDAATGFTVKAEALLRWRHPEFGYVDPNLFIPIAEETDLIQSIGAWVFCQASDMAKRWNSQQEDGQIRRVSVNVSPRQLLRGNPHMAYSHYVQEIGLTPEALIIELTEGLLLEDKNDVQQKLHHFHQVGMKLALDDFGTGYSAMAYLKRFNITYLKIDKSFVRELETNASDLAITEAIIAMAHRLGLEVIAEGVETLGQHNFLQPSGCEYLQGYFYARPMCAEAFIHYTQTEQATNTLTS